MHYNNQEPKTDDATPVAPTNNDHEPTQNNAVTETVTAQSNEPDSEDSKPTETKDDSDSPEWFMKDKFKTIDDQAKSYKELSTKMGKFWGSPQEQYAIDGVQGVEQNDPLIAALTPGLKEMGISQEGFNHLVNQYMDANKVMVKSMEENLKKTLTETDAHTYNSITKWMDDHLTADEAIMVKNNWLMTPEDFHLFNNLRLMAAPSTNVPSAATSPVVFESTKEVTNDKIKYKTELKNGSKVKDRNYEDQLAARFRDAAAREQRNKGR